MNDTDAGDYAIGQAHAPEPVRTVQAKPERQTFQPNQKLEPFLLLFKNARGAAAADLIMKALSAPGVFVFGELLDHPTVIALESSPQFATQLQLLRLFAYGTWSDYIANQSTLAELNKAQQTKLKQLTIITLAREDRIIPYDFLLQSLDLPSIPALEDLIIEAFYANLLRGRMDQRRSRLEIISCLGRDVRPSPSLSANVANAFALVDATGAASITSAAQNMELDSNALPTTDVALPLAAPITLARGEAHTLASLTQSLTIWQNKVGSILKDLDFHIAKAQSDAINSVAEESRYHDDVTKLVTEIASKGKDKEEKKAEVEATWEASPGMGMSNTGAGGFAQGGKLVSGGGADGDEEDGMDVDDVKGKKSTGPATRKSKRGRV